MVLLLLLLLLGGLTPDDVALGAALVCAEARGEDHVEQMAVGAVVRNRVDLGVRGRTVREVILARRQFAEPCKRPLVRLSHAVAFVRGYTHTHGLPWLTRDVVAFCTPRAARRVGARWATQWEAVPRTGTAHVFWRRPSPSGGT